MSKTIRVDEQTRNRIAALATETNQSMTSVVEQALASFERQRFFEAFDDGYQKLRDDSPAWNEIERERNFEAGVLSEEVS